MFKIGFALIPFVYLKARSDNRKTVYKLNNHKLNTQWFDYFMPQKPLVPLKMSRLFTQLEFQINQNPKFSKVQFIAYTSPQYRFQPPKVYFSKLHKFKELEEVAVEEEKEALQKTLDRLHEELKEDLKDFQIAKYYESQIFSIITYVKIIGLVTLGVGTLALVEDIVKYFKHMLQ